MRLGILGVLSDVWWETQDKILPSCMVHRFKQKGQETEKPRVQGRDQPGVKYEMDHGALPRH